MTQVLSLAEYKAQTEMNSNVICMVEPSDVTVYPNGCGLIPCHIQGLEYDYAINTVTGKIYAFNEGTRKYDRLTVFRYKFPQ